MSVALHDISDIHAIELMLARDRHATERVITDKLMRLGITNASDASKYLNTIWSKRLQHKRPYGKLILHGGAWQPNALSDKQYNKEIEHIFTSVLRDGRKELLAGTSALDVVQNAIRRIEDSGRFNAGKGALNGKNTTCETHAGIMDGRDLRFGGVIGASRFENPIDVARVVMDYSPHPVMIGESLFYYRNHPERPLEINKTFGEKFVRALNSLKLSQEEPDARCSHSYNSECTSTSIKQDLLSVNSEHKSSKQRVYHTRDTVGAVAIDLTGSTAACSSTGGITPTLLGRISPTSICGGDAYANNKTCAVAATGTGDRLWSTGGCEDVHARMQYGGASLQEALKAQLTDVMTAPQSFDGMIAIDKNGNHAAVYDAGAMPWGVIDTDGNIEFGGFAPTAD